ncbi:RNA-directed DNA polymerase, eukaryota, reverse transcriptase zinc-binding domain protein [Tanacetum coccineum]
MVVQKWDIDVDINKVEHDKLPIWVKLMRNKDIGRLRYTRVLIEVEAKKGLPEFIGIYCNVFGHKEGKCKLTKEKEGIKERATQDEQEKRKFKDNSEKENKDEDKGRVGSAHNSPRSAWNVNEDILSAIKKTANKFTILQEEVDVECVLESHMKKDRLEKVCNKIYGNWHWQNNLKFKTNYVLHGGISKIQYQVFCTFIYAANHGRDKKELWKDLGMYKRMIGNEDWVIMGEMNVILNTNEHSEGISYVTQNQGFKKRAIAAP